ncbi:MAG TPA: hypothetical protein PKC12_04950 [Thiobacillaceae bacterium]|nr:hypothetical protein [Thiobacillaceae bacterium]
MHVLHFDSLVPTWRELLSELRIDVAQAPSDIEKQLESLHRRLNRPGDALYDLPTLCIQIPGLVLRYREADGEHYVYVEDRARGRLAGYVVFNRLVEVDRRADPHLRAPHARFAAAYQRRGIATAIYRWWLDRGNTLITGARQSPGANALWHALARRYELFYVELRDKRLRYLGHSVDSGLEQDLHTRMVMLGRDADLASLSASTGMQHVQARVDTQREPMRRIKSRKL